MDDKKGRFYLGGLLDQSGERGEALLYDSDELTTHGVIVGMTGSGKTGLGVCLLEEALLDGIPTIVIDPKGDMENLLLNFPDFKSSDFLPWMDEGQAKREEKTVEQLAESTADLWRSGLEGWEIGSERMRRMESEVGMTIYTPGSTAGVPLNILGSLSAPDIGFDDDAETLRDEIEGYVSSLLTLAGVESDPVSGAEHILVANIIEHAWKAGTNLDLATLIASIQNPPFRKMGVFEVDSFYSPKDRTELALRLNGLVASPSFASWLSGDDLDIDELLHKGDRPQAAIMYLAHLSDSERQFVVTLLLSKLVTWMRSQSGTSELRALVYMDEVFGYCPPTAEPPSKKPILTLLKQARAFGVGVVLSTQNPVDLDYKAMSNAGTWMIGRLQTERDKARILEGIESASGTVDVSAFDSQISNLPKRAFVLTRTKTDQPQVFTTRWAMSYLAGPLTRDEIKRLTPTNSTAATAPPKTEVAPPLPVGIVPIVAEGVETVFADPAASWLQQCGGTPSGTHLAAGAVATVRLLYDDVHAGVEHIEEYEAVILPLTAGFDPANLHAVDHDPRDFSADGSGEFTVTAGGIDKKTYWTSLGTALRDHLAIDQKIAVHKCPGLKLYGRVGESLTDFQARCQSAADDAADQDMAKLRDAYSTKIERVQDQLAVADRRVRELEVDVSGRKQTELLSAATDVLGALLGGRSTGRALSRAASKRSQTRSTGQRLDTAAQKATEKQLEIDELEDELAAEILAIAEKWDILALEIEEVEIGLEKTDISIQSLRLLWVPVDV